MFEELPGPFDIKNAVASSQPPGRKRMEEQNQL